MPSEVWQTCRHWAASQRNIPEKKPWHHTMGRVAAGQHVAATCGGDKKRFGILEEKSFLWNILPFESALTILNLLAELFWHVSSTKHPQKLVFEDIKLLFLERPRTCNFHFSCRWDSSTLFSCTCTMYQCYSVNATCLSDITLLQSDLVVNVAFLKGVRKDRKTRRRRRRTHHGLV